MRSISFESPARVIAEGLVDMIAMSIGQRGVVCSGVRGPDEWRDGYLRKFPVTWGSIRAPPDFWYTNL